MTIKRALGIAMMLFSGWIATMALVMRFTGAAPAAVVILPSDDLMRNLPEAAILAETGFSVTLKSEAEGFVESLYAGGAWLVLPACRSGWLPAFA